MCRCINVCGHSPKSHHQPSRHTHKHSQTTQIAVDCHHPLFAHSTIDTIPRPRAMRSSSPLPMCLSLYPAELCAGFDRQIACHLCAQTRPTSVRLDHFAENIVLRFLCAVLCPQALARLVHSALYDVWDWSMSFSLSIDVVKWNDKNTHTHNRYGHHSETHISIELVDRKASKSERIYLSTLSQSESHSSTALRVVAHIFPSIWNCAFFKTRFFHLNEGVLKSMNTLFQARAGVHEKLVFVHTSDVAYIYCCAKKENYMSKATLLKYCFYLFDINMGLQFAECPQTMDPRQRMRAAFIWEINVDLQLLEYRSTRISLFCEVIVHLYYIYK